MKDLEDIYSDLYVVADMFDTVLIQITQCREEPLVFGLSVEQTIALNEAFDRIAEITRAAKTISVARINRVSFELSKAAEESASIPKEWVDSNSIKNEWD
jgi:hypothetical protein